jgi:chromate transporter
MTQKPSFQETFKFWFKLGFISFGGPAGQIAIMHDFVVEKEKWISESKFLHALNYCMLLPGPEAQQLATYIGWLLYGVRGGLVAGVLFVLPSVFILLGLSVVYVLYGTLPLVAAMFTGLKPAVVAIVLLAFIKIAKKALISPFHYVLAALSFIGIFFFNVSFPLIILTALLIGLVIKKIRPAFLQQKSDKKEKIINEADYFINKDSVVPGAGISSKKIVLQVLLGLCLWALPLLILLFSYEDRSFWSTLVLFFTESALVTFGGAYAVLPFVAQYSVEKLHWLSKATNDGWVGSWRNYTWSTDHGTGFCWVYGRL